MHPAASWSMRSTSRRPSGQFDYFTFLVAFLMGMNSLLIYNLLIASVTVIDNDYFQGRNWISYWPMVVGLGTLVGTCSGAVMQRRLKFHITMLGSTLVVILGTVGFLVGLVVIRNFKPGFYGALVCAGIVALASAFYRASYMGLLFTLTPDLVWAEHLGCGVAGVVSWFVFRFVNAFANDRSSQSMVIVVAFTTCCIWQLCTTTTHLHFCKYGDEVETLVSQETALPPPQYGRTSTSVRVNLKEGITLKDRIHHVRDTTQYSRNSSLTGFKPRQLIDLFRASYQNALAAAGVLFGTFLIFPYPILAIDGPEVWGPDGYAAFLNGIFQLVDALSRVLAKWPIHTQLILRANVARLIFVPLAYLCQRHSGSPIWGNMYLHTALMIAVAGSNGYLLTAASCQGTTAVTHPSEKMKLGPWVNLWAQFGMNCGLMLKYVLGGSK